jgi:hypothetical protein
MMRMTHVFAVAAIAAASTGAFGQSVPVQVGGDADFDACSSNGEVSGLDPDGDNFLAVRRGPGTRYAETTRLDEGEVVAICGERGGWYAIVFPRNGQDLGDCGVGSPIPRRQAYRGPCRSGWVFGRYVRVTAG